MLNLMLILVIQTRSEATCYKWKWLTQTGKRGNKQMNYIPAIRTIRMMRKIYTEGAERGGGTCGCGRGPEGAENHHGKLPPGSS